MMRRRSDRDSAFFQRLFAIFSRRDAELRFEHTAELGLVAEAPLIGDAGDGLLAGRIAKRFTAGVQSLVADPAAERLIGVAKQFVQIPGRNAAGARDCIGVEVAVSEPVADIV